MEAAEDVIVGKRPPHAVVVLSCDEDVVVQSAKLALWLALWMALWMKHYNTETPVIDSARVSAL
ncbi:MAG: hypothetical protein ACI3Y4_07740 [Candidatus Cryptobacteroides sp.]